MDYRRIAAGLAVGLFFSGCSLRTLATRQTADILVHGMASFERETDVDLAADAMPAHLKMIEALLENDPENQSLLSLLAYGFAAYAYLFIEDQDPARAKALYSRAKDYGLKVLAKRGLVPENAFELDAWKVSLAQAAPADVEALFWTANAWGLGINLSRDDPMALADLPIPAELATRARDLDPAYYHGGPDAFLGFYHAARPKLFGGNPELAKEHFDASLGRTGGKFLLNKVLFAQTYAVQVQDRELFERTLREVLEGAPEDYPQGALGSAAAQRKAKRLMEKIDELF